MKNCGLGGVSWVRCVAPVKYGIKHIKRIGRITFTNERPGDFRAERGYDWYFGH